MSVEYEEMMITKLNKDELISVCKNVGFDIFLTPMKQNPKKYSNYVKKLGRLDKNSQVVKTFLPGFVVELCCKIKDKVYVDIMEDALNTYKAEFEDVISNKLSKQISVDEIQHYDAFKLAKLYIDIYKISTIDFSAVFFFAMLKLFDISVENADRAGEVIDFLLQIEKDVQEQVNAAKKEYEDTLTAEKNSFNSERKEWEKQKRSYERTIHEYEKDQQSKKANQETQRISLETQWHEEFEARENEAKQKRAAEFEKELEGKRQALLDEMKQKEDEFEERQREKSDDEEKRLADMKSAGEKQITEQERTLEEQRQELNRISQSINVLKEEQGAKESYIRNFEEIEKSFFDHFEERIYSKCLESKVFSRLSHGSVSGEEDKPGCIRNYRIIEPVEYEGNVESASEAMDIDDFIDDLKDNLAISFNNVSDIAKSIVSAIAANRPMIIDTGCFNLVAKYVSCLLSGKSPLMLELASNGSIFEALDQVKKSPSKVVCIKGVLDNFDENQFVCICNNISDRILFFEIGDIDKLSLMSRAICKNAVVLDIDSELKISTQEPVFVGNHNIHELLSKKNKKSTDVILDKLLKNKSLATSEKSVLISMADIISWYFTVSKENESLGEVMQRIVRHSAKSQEGLDEIAI